MDRPWEVPHAGPARRPYVVTPAGEAALADWAADLEEVERLLDDLARRFRAASAGRTRRRSTRRPLRRTP